MKDTTHSPTGLDGSSGTVCLGGAEQVLPGITLSNAPLTNVKVISYTLVTTIRNSFYTIIIFT